MAINLQQTALDPNGTFGSANTAEVVKAVLEDTQGNILKSHGRDNGHHLFVAFPTDLAEPGPIRRWLATMSAYVTSAWAQYEQKLARHARGTDGGTFVNLGLSATGYTAAGLTAVMPDDTSFAAGAKNRIGWLNDPPVEQWDEGFRGPLDAIVMVADDDPERLHAFIQMVRDSLQGVGRVVHEEIGHAMRVDKNGNLGSGQVHEHFGYADGVSQPLFFADDLEAERLRSGGFDHYDPSAALDLVLLKDPGGGPSGHGSYFVYRKLGQNVPGFTNNIVGLAKTLFATDSPTPEQAALAGAYAVGRFKDGTPVVAQAEDGWTTEPNDFNFDADPDGVRCPFQAHIRKVNPRGDKQRQFALPMGEDRARRIARRAVSFGPLTLDPTPDDKVGLLFICAQSSIVDQFEFLQAVWSNFPDFLRPATGLDAVIGQAPGGTPTVDQQWPKLYGSPNALGPDGNVVDPFVPFRLGEWVTMLGGEYFFLPSLSMLAGASSGS